MDLAWLSLEVRLRPLKERIGNRYVLFAVEPYSLGLPVAQTLHSRANIRLLG